MSEFGAVGVVLEPENNTRLSHWGQNELKRPRSIQRSKVKSCKWRRIRERRMREDKDIDQSCGERKESLCIFLWVGERREQNIGQNWGEKTENIRLIPGWNTTAYWTRPGLNHQRTSNKTRAKKQRILAKSWAKHQGLLGKTGLKHHRILDTTRQPWRITTWVKKQRILDKTKSKDQRISEKSRAKTPNQTRSVYRRDKQMMADKNIRFVRSDEETVN